MNNKLKDDCHILIKYEAGQAGCDIVGDKTDLKDLLYSLMHQDRVFASLCAIALLDFVDNNPEFDSEKPIQAIINLANEQIKEGYKRGQAAKPGEKVQTERLLEGLVIIDKARPKGDTHFHIRAEHDEIIAGSLEWPISPEDRQRLEALGWEEWPDYDGWRFGV